MAGLYLHIPFCARRCGYCDFFSTTEPQRLDEYLEGMGREMAARKGELRGEPLHTLYIGGGTPSLMSLAQLERLFEMLEEHFDLTQLEEATLEANPGDLTREYLRGLSALPLNRLSIGVQSFVDDDLLRMGRRHTACEAREAVRRAQAVGFCRLSIDLIYGLPGQTLAEWESSLAAACALEVEHVSAYHLTYEEGTPFAQRLERGEYDEASEAQSLAFYHTLLERLAAHGIEQYEISNFARRGGHSRHNSSYWDGTPYLGVGCSAHSYDGQRRRRANVASLGRYLRDEWLGEAELLTDNDLYNEYLMTSLRTVRGVDLAAMRRRFGAHSCDALLALLASYATQGLAQITPTHAALTPEGLFVSDRVICAALR